MTTTSLSEWSDEEWRRWARGVWRQIRRNYPQRQRRYVHCHEQPCPLRPPVQDDLYAIEAELERKHEVFAPLSGRDAVLQDEADRYYLGEDTWSW